MRLEFEPNASVLPFVENEVAAQGASSEVERMLREGVKAAQEGNRGEARKVLLRVTETDENNENAWLWLASISEYPEELLVFLNNVLRVNPVNERALEWHKATKSLLAKTLVQRGVDAISDERPDFARQCFEQALEHEAENEMAWLWMASVADTDEEKKDCFEKVLSVNPDNETARVSLESIQSQKTQKLLQDALYAAFDGHHASAQEILETVLNKDSELEDAWVLKSHLATSFEERAECFLKLRVLNPENEMAKANLASWRTLADKVAALPKAEETPEAPAKVSAEAYVEEFSSAEPFVEETASEDFSAEFSNYPAPESFVEDEPAHASEKLSAELESENEVLEVENQFSETTEPETVSFDEAVSEQPKYLSDEELYKEEYALPDSPTQELSFDPEFQFAREAVSTETETAQSQAAEPAAESDEPEEVKSFDEELPETDSQFEASESPETTGHVSAWEDLAAELEAEESEMHSAFSELTENKEPETDSQELADEAVSSEVRPESLETAAEVSDPAANQEPLTEEWRNTSPDVFVNYSPSIPENPIEMITAELPEPAPVEEPVNSELVAPEEPIAEVSVAGESDAPEMLAENNYLHQFAETVEEAAPAEEVVELKAEDVVEEQVEEVFEAQSEEAVVELRAEAVIKTPSQEFPHSKVEMMLCPFCNTENEKQAFSCVSCQTILTLSDLEMLLNQQNANQEKLRQTVASLESENESYGLNAEQLAYLGIGHVNLKNYRQGFFYLQEAVRMNPNNVLLDAQVNALAIRLAEIEEQQSAHDSMIKNRRILVVDDSPTVRKLISGKLEKCGHEVICAVDGIDALQKINDLVPDLILLDITMPRMDGYQVCKLIRTNEQTKEVPVVMISGKDGFFDKVRGKMAGTTGYITKPFGPETLMKTVETYLN
jgi:CheY-like chemotaxis protein